MDEVVTKVAASGLFNGSVLVAQNGTILLNKGYGLANREQNIPNTSQTVFRIGSIGKQFTAMGIMVLQAQGKLDVRDPACKYLTVCPETWQAITIHHLLTHTSGVVIDSPNLISKPGTKFLYNNDGYRLLGEIIEQASGKPYDVFMQEMIFEPLMMSHTNFIPHQENEAVGYTTYMMSGIPAHYSDPADFQAVGGHYSTLEDLYLWDQALYTEQLIPPELLETMYTPYESVASDPILQIYGDQTGYGYGLLIGQVNGHKAIGHMGVVEGFHTLMSRYPDDNLVIIVLSNHSDGPVDLITSLLVKKVFGEE